MSIKAAFLRGFEKEAERVLSKKELAQIDQAQQKPFPQMFKAESDPITAGMGSPNTTGILGAAGGALGGGFLGNMIGQSTTDDPGIGTALMTVLGAGGGAYLGNTAGNQWRSAKNRDLQSAMTRLPVGAKQRDLASLNPSVDSAVI